MLCFEGCHYEQPKSIDDACRIYQEFPGWLAIGKKVEKRWGTPLSLQLAIIYTESSFQAQAQPKRKFMHLFPESSARGYGQALDSAWRLYIHSTQQLGADRESFRDASDFIGWYTHKTKQDFDMPYSNAFGQYLAYHEGWGGYASGSYKGHRELIQTAKKVQKQAGRYQKQLISCSIVKGENKK